MKDPRPPRFLLIFWSGPGDLFFPKRLFRESISRQIRSLGLPANKQQALTSIFFGALFFGQPTRAREA